MVEIRAEIAATVWKVEVEVGQAVAADHELIILESMKMEIPVIATAAGTVSKIHVAPEDRINEGDLLVTLE
jgi:biotin carboxyl carrier protein